MNPEIKYLLESSGKSLPPVVKTEEEVVEYLLELIEGYERQIQVLHSLSKLPSTKDYKQQEIFNDSRLQEPFG